MHCSRVSPCWVSGVYAVQSHTCCTLHGYPCWHVHSHCMDAHKHTHSKRGCSANDVCAASSSCLLSALWPSQASQQQRPLRAGGHRSIQRPVAAQKDVGHSWKLQQWRIPVQSSKKLLRDVFVCLLWPSEGKEVQNKLLCNLLGLTWKNTWKRSLKQQQEYLLIHFTTGKKQFASCSWVVYFG